MSDVDKELKELKKKLSDLENKINNSKNNLFGKPSSEIGSLSTDTVIKTSGNLKVRYGSKYVTIFKDGKLVTSENSELIHVSKTIGTKDGLWVIKTDDPSLESSIYLVSKGQSYPISTSKDVYISFIESQTLSSDKKELALKNAGFLYSNLSEFENNPISNSLIYVLSDNKLYLVKDGTPYEFKIEVPNEFNNLRINNLTTNNIALGNTKINSNKISVFSQFLIADAIFRGNGIFVLNINCDSIRSLSENGYSLLKINDKYVLNIDFVLANNLLGKSPLYYPYDIIINESFEFYYNNFDYIEDDIIATYYKGNAKINLLSYTESSETIKEKINDHLIEGQEGVMVIDLILSSDIENFYTKGDDYIEDSSAEYYLILKNSDNFNYSINADGYCDSYERYYKQTIIACKKEEENNIILNQTTNKFTDKYVIDDPDTDVVLDYELTLYDIVGNKFIVPIGSTSIPLYIIRDINISELLYFLFKDSDWVLKSNYELIDYNSIIGNYIYPIIILGKSHNLFNSQTSTLLFPNVKLEDNLISVDYLDYIINTLNSDKLGLLLRNTSDNTLPSYDKSFFARYSDDSLSIPESCHDKTLITKEWILNYLNYTNTFSTGMILPFYGDNIPKGWVLCDGNVYDENGNITTDINSGKQTPNLSNGIIIGEGNKTSGDYLSFYSSEVATTEYNLIALKYIMKL